MTIFHIVIFFFFAAFYNNHLHFLEQSQCFILTRDYFLNKISLPGGLSGYAGEFLTQFYFYSLAGPLIITSLLFVLQQVSGKIFALINPDKNLFVLSFFPALLYAILLCDEYYPLSGLVGLLLALAAAWFYMLIHNTGKRFFAGIFLIPALYWIAGGSYIVLSSIAIIREVLLLPRSENRSSGNVPGSKSGISSFRYWHVIVFALITISFPLIIRSTVLFQPLNLAFLSEFYYDLRTVIPAGIVILFVMLPVITVLVYYTGRYMHKSHVVGYLLTLLLLVTGYAGFKLTVNFDAEDIYKYDQFARNGKWDELISFSEKHPPANDLSLSMLNLALAKTGRMGFDMFRYEQNGDDGLFLPGASDYFSLIHRSEIFFHLGLLNASQESAFESMETTSDLKKPVRAIKRLTEISLLTGHFEIARKYIKILSKTVFYRKWAAETEKYLTNEASIDENPEWTDIRKNKPVRDFFFKAQNINSVIDMLQLSLEDYEEKRIVFEYLMAHYLINKDLLSIINFMPFINKINYREIPLNYQEALLYTANIISGGNTPEIQNYTSNFTRERMNEYFYTLATKGDPREYPMKKFKGTYWYYFDFKNIKIGK